MRRIREERGLAVKQVARAIGVAPTTYREWEYGRAILGEPYVKLADAFGVSLHELMTGSLPRPSKALEMAAEMERLAGELRKELASFI